MMLYAQAALLLIAPLTHRKLVDASPAYSYDPFSDVGPDVWKALVMDDNQCGGTSNSPIALESEACTVFADYKFDVSQLYSLPRTNPHNTRNSHSRFVSLHFSAIQQSGTCTFKDYGFAINDHVHQASLPANGTCTPATMEVPGVDGTFELIQFHIHTNSEHTMDGDRYAAELHMVHQLQGGDRLAVMGVFIRANAFDNNALFTPVLAEFDGAADATAMNCNMTVPDHWWLHDNSSAVATDSVFQIYDLIPEGSTYYNYDGGLTTPPCSEIVEWNVADKPLSISIAQYNDLSSLILNYVAADTCEPATIASPSGSTSRPVQDLNGRNVSRICPVDFKDPLAEEESTATSGASLVQAGVLVTTLMAAMASFA